MSWQTYVWNLLVETPGEDQHGNDRDPGVHDDKAGLVELEQLDCFGRLGFATRRFRLVPGSVRFPTGVVRGDDFGAGDAGAAKFARTFEIVGALFFGFHNASAVSAQRPTSVAGGGTIFDARDASRSTGGRRGTVKGRVDVIVKVGPDQNPNRAVGPGVQTARRRLQCYEQQECSEDDDRDARTRRPAQHSLHQRTSALCGMAILFPLLKCSFLFFKERWFSDLSFENVDS
jgi:hypothetical protein